MGVSLYKSLIFNKYRDVSPIAKEEKFIRRQKLALKEGYKNWGAKPNIILTSKYMCDTVPSWLEF